MRPLLSLSLLLALVNGCTCAESHEVDAGTDATDAGADAAVDAGVDALDAGDPGPLGTCEDVFEDPAGPRGCTTPGEIQWCGHERCCRLTVRCSDTLVWEPGRHAASGDFEPGEVSCDDEPVQPECALAASNADLTITVDGRAFALSHAYVDHGVGFDTSASVTFTSDDRADVCSAQRVSILRLGPEFDPERPAYVGRHDAGFTVYDAESSPPWRFVTGEVVITSSLGFREGGPLSGTVRVDDGDVQITGSFDAAAECLPWRTSGS